MMINKTDRNLFLRIELIIEGPKMYRRLIPAINDLLKDGRASALNRDPQRD
jgi:hypothetical protein